MVCVYSLYRVLDILTYWIKKCWPDFYRHQELVSILLTLHTPSQLTLHTPTHPQLDMTNQFIEDLKTAKDPNFNLAGTNLAKTVAEKVG